MKSVGKFFSVFTLIIVLFGTHQAQAKEFGLGVIAGNPTGLSLKSWSSKTKAWDAALAWSGSSSSAYVHMDQLFHNYKLLRVRSAGKFGVYYGFGGAVALATEAKNNGLGVAARIPVGLTYLFAEAPLDVFIEAAGSLLLIPDTAFGVDPAIGARFYF